MSTLTVLASIAQDTVSSSSLLYALLGLFTWELFETWDVEWKVISRGRARQFPLLQFVLCRLLVIGALIGLAISHTSMHEVDCKPLYRFASFASSLAISMAFALFMTHTFTLYETRAIKIPLIFLLIASFTLCCLHTFIVVDGGWDPVLKCERIMPTTTRDNVLRHLAFFFPFGLSIVLFLCALFGVLGLPRSESTPVLKHFLLENRLLYYIIAIVMLSLPAILNAAHIDDVDDLVNVPAFVFSAVAACRLAMAGEDLRPARRRRGEDMFVHSSSLISSTHAYPNTHAVPRTRISQRLSIPVSALEPDPLTPSTPPKDEEHSIQCENRRWSQDSTATRELSIKFVRP